jgi:multicomponent Na+:H+ antiporter subunit D
VYFAFFNRDGGHRVDEAPASMLVAMGIAAFFCIFLGVYPKFFYAMLPYSVEFEPYTVPHVVAQLQLLLFTGLGFVLLLLSGIYPAEIRAINIDADLIYRKGGRLFYQVMATVLNGFNKMADKVLVGGIVKGLSRFASHGPANLMLLVFKPYWNLSGLNVQEQATARDKLYRQVEAGVLPVSIMGLFAMLYFGLLFLL